MNLQYGGDSLRSLRLGVLCVSLGPNEHPIIEFVGVSNLAKGNAEDAEAQ